MIVFYSISEQTQESLDDLSWYFNSFSYTRCPSFQGTNKQAARQGDGEGVLSALQGAAGGRLL